MVLFGLDVNQSASFNHGGQELCGMLIDRDEL